MIPVCLFHLYVIRRPGTVSWHGVLLWLGRSVSLGGLAMNSRHEARAHLGGTGRERVSTGDPAPSSWTLDSLRPAQHHVLSSS